MEDENNILIEYDIVKGISFNGDTSGTSNVIVNVADLFSKRALNKINFKIKTGAQDTHELCW